MPFLSSDAVQQGSRWAIVVVLLIASGYTYYRVASVTRDTNAGPQRNRGDRISALQLFGEFQSNQADAERRYGGRVMVISGRVKEITSDTQLALTLGENLASERGVVAYFAEGHREALTSLHRGDRVSVACRVDRMMSVWVFVRECRLMTDTEAHP